MESIFLSKDYRDYLTATLGAVGRRTGRRSAAALYIGCHAAYLGRVLKKEANVSHEQAYALAEFLNLDPEETDFFLLSVQYERAGTVKLRTFLKAKIDAARAEHTRITSKIPENAVANAADQARYYSHWSYGATHALVSIPDCQTIADLAERLGMDKPTVTAIVSFLQNIGCIEKFGNKLRHKASQIHLADHSPNIVMHHTNWRYRCLSSLIHPQIGDQHYSAAVSMSLEAAERIRADLLTNLQKHLKWIAAAREEEAYSYSFDFFKL